MSSKCKESIKWILDKLSNVKLKRKIIVSFVIIVAIPILAVAFFLFYNFEAYVRNSTIKDHKYQVDIEHDKMINNVSIMNNISQVLLSNDEVLKFLNESYKMQNYDFYEFSLKTYKYLSNLQNNNQYISSFEIFFKNNEINEMWPFLYNKRRVSDEEWYKEIVNSDKTLIWDLYHYNDDIHADLYTGKKPRELVVSLNSNIKDKDNNNIGVLRISMKVDDFLPMMTAKTLNNYNSVYIYNSEDKLISGEESFPAGEMTKEDRDKFFEDISDKLVGGSGSFEWNESKEKIMVLYKKAPISNHYIVDVISLDSLTEQITTLKIYTMGGTIIVILILIFVIWIMTDLILKRLYLIIDSLKEIKDGNFNADIPVYGEDEIGLLAYNFKKMMMKIDSLIKGGIKKEMATKEAEVKALKTQIDAHFLYNTLENIKMMAELEGNYMVSDSLVALGDLMRYNTKWSNEYVMLNEEVLHIKNYISLMAIRFDYDINLHINVDEKVRNISILKMIIQPLVENAVKHGISKNLNYKDGNIYINIGLDDNFIIITVADDGVGMSEGKRVLLEEHIQGNLNSKYGLGLRNVYERIRLAYGRNSNVSVESQLEKGTRLILSIPRQ